MAAPLDALVNPPFATDPPFKISIDARIIGLVIAILSALVGLLVFLTLLALLGVGYQSSYGSLYVLDLVDVVLNLIADALGLIGGIQMLRGNPGGRRLVVYGLALAFIIQVALGLGFGTGVSAIVTLVLLVVLYYAVVVSRFPGEGLAANR
jgi:hypothetical protein